LNPLENNQGFVNFGYGDSLMTQAVKDFQSFFGIQPTGECVVLFTQPKIINEWNQFYNNCIPKIWASTY